MPPKSAHPGTPVLPKKVISFSDDEIRHMFNVMDTNQVTVTPLFPSHFKDGHLTVVELEVGVRALGVRYDPESFVRAVGRAGLELDHDVTFEVEFSLAP